MALPIRSISLAVALAAAGSLASPVFADDSTSKSGNTMQSAGMTKDPAAMKKDSMAPDAMNKDSMGKDAMGSGAMKKDSMGSDAMGQTAHDSMAPEKK
ncbi:pentapeptide MXKDX repeat protein [Hyphomicrobium facile]|uniref:Pentapeptide MXKDX repeat protein n=1 Tax=Hyphomicrobium facile TaxID=51670 RepID=A0A1I7NU04_9HYPH|nr:pentapeptide MXKDX repeat protein [Hyphomicrobium facile]SFV38137.1 pentapeptide MXKDX repeat protein [Hyphomicrobium facile]